jgi:hypothetical protein
MKKVFYYSLVCFLSLAIYSCDKESEDVAQVNAKSSEGITVDSYLSEKYDSYDAVESITITVDDENIKVTKFNVGDENVDVYTFSTVGSNMLNESLMLDYQNYTLLSDDFVNKEFMEADFSDGDSRLIDLRAKLLDEIASNTVTYGDGLWNGDRWWGYTCGSEYYIGDKCYRGCSYRTAGFLTASLGGPQLCGARRIRNARIK